jgi:topoisomerase IV subunit A
VSSLAETGGTAIVGMLSGPADIAVLLGTTGGNALRARLESFITRIRAGKQFVSMDKAESLLSPTPIPAEAKEVAALSAEGRILVFPLDEVKELAAGGKGVMAIRLHEGEKMLGIVPVHGELRIAAIGRGEKRTTLTVNAGALQHYRGARARSGRVLQPSFKRVEGFE